jgi:hypothetical protein
MNSNNTTTTEYLPSRPIVRVIADGTIGELTWSDSEEVHLVHGDAILGRGPWIMRREQVEVASAGEAEAYRGRCSALAA